MAEVGYIGPVESLGGKLNREDNVYFRQRNGKQFAVKMENPRSTFSQKEQALHAGMGTLSKLASQIAKDAVLAAPYMADFEEQKKSGAGQTSLYQYLITRFLKEAKSDRAAKIAELQSYVANGMGTIG